MVVWVSGLPIGEEVHHRYCNDELETMEKSAASEGGRGGGSQQHSRAMHGSAMVLGHVRKAASSGSGLGSSSFGRWPWRFGSGQAVRAGGAAAAGWVAGAAGLHAERKKKKQPRNSTSKQAGSRRWRRGGRPAASEAGCGRWWTAGRQAWPAWLLVAVAVSRRRWSDYGDGVVYVAVATNI